jgi:hypothetical protein
MLLLQCSALPGSVFLLPSLYKTEEELLLIDLLNSGARVMWLSFQLHGRSRNRLSRT